MRLHRFFIVAMLFASGLAAHADTYTFSTTLTNGTTTGILAGTIDLGFVANGGPGTGTASSLILTSIPAALGPLSTGNTATDWATQAANSFTVINGTITSYLFNAYASSSTNYLCMNSTNAAFVSGGDTCQPGLIELQKNEDNYSYNISGLQGVTFTDISLTATPEPSSFMLLGTGVLGMVGAVRRRFTA